MEAHNANTHLVQPNFCVGDYVLRAEPKRVQHKLTLIWKGPYQVDKVFDSHTLRVNSLINGAQFITHVTRTRLYQDALLQTAEGLQAAAHFNNTVEFVVEKYGPLSKERTTGELCVLTKWRGFDEAENTEEPVYDKWIDTPRMLKEIYSYLTKGTNWRFKALPKSRNGRTTLATTSRARLATPTPAATTMGRRKSYISNYLFLLNLCFAMGRCCV
jgi:hypothetical protein